MGTQWRPLAELFFLEVFAFAQSPWGTVTWGTVTWGTVTWGRLTVPQVTVPQVTVPQGDCEIMGSCPTPKVDWEWMTGAST